MKRLTFIVCLSLALFASLAIADDSSRDNSEQTRRYPFDPSGTNSKAQLDGGTLNASKAAVDTVRVYGGNLVVDGKFQTLLDSQGAGVPDAQGWIGKDSTNMSATWHISDYNCTNLDPVADNLAMWCGEIFPGPCEDGDPVEGYDNNYNLWLDWYGEVTPVEGVLPVSTTVNVKAHINSNSEIDYDYLLLEVETLGFMELVNDPTFPGTASGDVAFTNVFVYPDSAGSDLDVSFVVTQDSYVGDDANQVHLRFRGFADTGYSDGDCLWPSNGLAQIDDIAVSFDGVLKTTDTFQPGDPVSWVNVKPPFVGDFHKVWPLLGDNDICFSNVTPQMAFVDDNIVVPGTGGTWPNPWNYGPNGAGVTTTGGLAGSDYGINNDVWSPILAWPAGSYDGGILEFDVYRHLPRSNGIFYQWAIRTSLDGGLTWPGSWKDANTVYYGGNLGEYLRSAFVVTTQINGGRNTAQIALGVVEAFLDELHTDDATPAPYFDNVRLLAFPSSGPALSITGAWSLFNDNWPAVDEINFGDLTQNSVRVDIANNISVPATGLNDPGDSCTVKFVARTGATAFTMRRMYVKMKINPLFDATCRTAMPALIASGKFTQTDNIIAGYVDGIATRINSPPYTTVPYYRTFDLPDTGFFFPGDMLHYYFAGQDVVGGVAGGISTLPADTTGFSAFPGSQYYDSARLYELYKIDALPTMITAEKDVGQPKLLFWDDSQDRGNQNEWFAALDHLGFRQGIDYDIYCNAGPSSGLGNGLGGRTNALKMSGYNTMVYSPGNLSAYTMSNGDPYSDAGNDIAVVDAWLGQGGKSILATGDNIAQDLSASGANAVTFLQKWFGVQFDAGDVGQYIGGQKAPSVRPITVTTPLSPVLFSGDYIVQGGCAGGGIADFDAITPIAPAVRIAQFLDANGNPMPSVGNAAAIYNEVAENTSRAVFMPYDLGVIWNGDKGVASRTTILRNILLFFGHAPGGAAVGVTPEAGVFTARNFPNPFNPSTKIEFNLPVKSQVELKIYNVRGELVKTLLNESRIAGTQSVVWDGRNSTGQSVSSGVYFYSLKAGSYEKMEKMTLVK